MVNNFFVLDEDFNSIIKNTLTNEFDVKEIQNIKFISTGWTNIVYEVKADNGSYFFRFPRDDFWERTIVKYYEFAKFIKGKTSFKTCELFLGYDKDRPFSVHKKIEGVPLAEKMNDMTDEEIEKVSKQVAQFMFELHNVDYSGSKIFDKTQNIGEHLNEFIDELLSVHVANEDMKFWQIDNFNERKNECLVHGDLNSSNVLLDENNNISAIIDFGFGGYGNKYNDIARIIGRCPEKFKQAIKSNYEKLENNQIEEDMLDKNIKIWSNIDQSYINYMRRIGIYK